VTAPEADVPRQPALTVPEAEALAEKEPQCCGDVMVLYPGVGWECAVTFFDLKDAGVLDVCDTGGTPPPLDGPDPTDEQRARYEHLLATRVPLLAGVQP